MSRLLKFQLLSANEVRNSPSRKDGMPPQTEASRRKIAAKYIYETGHRFQLSVGTSAIAVTFFLRYFARKSMEKNHPFIIAAGCLFLAGKVNDEPIPAQHLVAEMFKRWYGRDNPNMRARLADPAFTANLFASVLEAERAILHTVGFDFNVDLPHTYIALLLRQPRFEALGLKTNLQFQQMAISFCNDILRSDGTLVLQYRARDIAIAIFFSIFKLAQKRGLDTIPQVPLDPDGRPWYNNEGIDSDLCTEIVNRIMSLYTTAAQPAASSQAPAASAATTVGGHMLPAASGAGASAALGGGRGGRELDSAAAGGGRGAGKATASAAGAASASVAAGSAAADAAQSQLAAPSPSVAQGAAAEAAPAAAAAAGGGADGAVDSSARPAASQHAPLAGQQGQQPPAAGQKRRSPEALASAAAAPPAKAARHAAGNGALPQPHTQRPEAPGARAAPAPSPGAAAAAPFPALTPPGPAASEPEEGELEEGELEA